MVDRVLRQCFEIAGTPDFIRQNFAGHFQRLYLGCFSGDLDKIIQRHCEMMEILGGLFFIWLIVL